MKLFLKILAALVVLFIVLLIGLNLYFTDDRLKNMILPEVNEAIGREVQVETMSVTFFRTFPRFGVSIGKFVLPSDDEQPNVASLEELLVSVKLFPLIGGEIAFGELSMIRPDVNYIIYEDGTTNIDFLLELAEKDAEAEPEEEPVYAVAMPYFTLRNASLLYDDRTEKISVQFQGLDADLSLRFTDLIESTVNATLEGLTLAIKGENYIENLSLSLQQESLLDMDREILTLSEGMLSIRGLAVNVAGEIKNWSAEAPELDLQFTSSSENFGELLRLAPPEYDEYLSGLGSSGSLIFDGSVSGELAEGRLPQFNILVEVNNGYLKNPDLPEAIRDIRFKMDVSNTFLEVAEFHARAGDNSLNGSGSIERPFEEDGLFSLEANGDVDLSTVGSFYPLDELGIEELRGSVSLNANANGRLDQPETATFTSNFTLTDGLLKYADVPQSFEDINAVIRASEDLMRIESSGLKAAGNSFSMSGSVARPLDENERSFDITSNLDFDLATIKDFYPIDEDTLTMRGNLTADATLRGKADPDQIEQTLQNSRVEFRNGYLSHSSLGKPLEDITLIANANGSRLVLNEARFKSGNNNLQMSGNVQNYLGDNPIFDVSIRGEALLSDLSAYYSLEPWLNELTGDAKLNVQAAVPAGDPQDIALNGSFELQNVNASGDSLSLPITDLKGKLSATPESITLEDFSMNYGSSDFQIEGRLQNYLGFLQEHETEATMPTLSGSYRSKKLNTDEMIDWDAEVEDEPIPIELPELISTVTAEIDSLIYFGMVVTNLKGKGRTNPEQILLDEATATLFEGKASGQMTWNAKDPERTDMRFVGRLDSLQASSFFRDMNLFGSQGNIHEYLSGSFSADTDYFTEFDVFLNPDPATTKASGRFGMTKARLRGHPIQKRVAEWLRSSEIENLALDKWTATYVIQDTVLTFENFRMTSDDLGLQLDGTQHLVTDRINYQAELILPARFKNDIASVLSNRAADALTREDGKIGIPLKITGTSEIPRVTPDEKIIENMLKKFLKEDVGGALKKLFGG